MEVKHFTSQFSVELAVALTDQPVVSIPSGTPREVDDFRQETFFGSGPTCLRDPLTTLS
jgi:hypothetical protein